MTFRNFTAASRKSLLKLFGLLHPSANLDWIEGNSGWNRIAITGTQDGINLVFTVATGYANYQLALDGLTLAPTTDYTISGSTVTMTRAPLAAETLLAFGF